MGFGDTAKGALEQALNAYKAVVQLQGIVENLERNIEKFQERQERHLIAMEQRLSDRVRIAEERVRQLEGEVSSLRGKVDGGFVEALKLVLLEPETHRRLSERFLAPSDAALGSSGTKQLASLNENTNVPQSGTK